MRIVIDIPEQLYKEIMIHCRSDDDLVCSYIQEGTLPGKGHGRLIDANECKEKMRKYGFHAPDMTVTEFVDDMLTTVIPEDSGKSE